MIFREEDEHIKCDKLTFILAQEDKVMPCLLWNPTEVSSTISVTTRAKVLDFSDTCPLRLPKELMLIYLVILLSRSERLSPLATRSG